MRRLTAFALFSSLLALPAQADTPDADFFAGKNITVLIGYAAGGTYDATARLLARHMGSYSSQKRCAD